jgi:hypothetical protein
MLAWACLWEEEEEVVVKVVGSEKARGCRLGRVI